VHFTSAKIKTPYSLSYTHTSAVLYGARLRRRLRRFASPLCVRACVRSGWSPCCKRPSRTHSFVVVLVCDDDAHSIALSLLVVCTNRRKESTEVQGVFFFFC